MTQVCFSHTSWERLLARAGSVHLPRVVWWGQARAVSGLGWGPVLGLRAVWTPPEWLSAPFRLRVCPL